MKGTRQFGIEIGQNPQEGLRVYVDTAYADHPDGKSTEAFVIMYAGVLVIWASKKQTFVSTSTLISEFCAFTLALK